MSAPVKKNDDITLEITGMSSDGAGIGRADGFAVFVPGALPGETVEAHIIKAAGSYAVGKLTSIVSASKDRTKALCPSYGKCGGCSIQHMDYAAQLDFKTGVVRDALVRIGGFKDIKVNPTIGMKDPLRYRNKGSFPFAEIDGRVEWGLYAARSHRLIDASGCVIENENALSAAKAVAEWANLFGIPAYDETTGRGVLRHVVSRTCTSGTSVCVVTTGKLPHAAELIDLLREKVGGIVSIVHNVNPKKTNVILGNEFRTVWGGDTVEHSICGIRFKVSAESFLQVNTEQTETLYSLAADGLDLTGNETVADLFCGIGTISLLLAEKAAFVTGIEYVERAIADAKANAALNGFDNAEFFAGPAETILPRLVDEGRRFDCICLDPPRKGADPAVIKAIADSKAERIAYVSCDPATLARDLKMLSEYDYTIRSVQPVDMFPMTGHVESVVLMSRAGS